VVRKVLWRIIPFGVLLYVMNYVDRVNISIAKLSMQSDPGLVSDTGKLLFTDTVYAWGVGVFFIAYFLLEVPSNLIQEKVGPRRWIARIMISWALVSMAFVFVPLRHLNLGFVTVPLDPCRNFYILRFLLGAAEAGFFPGMILYLSQWIPARQRARAGAFFLTSTALSGVIGNPIGGFILHSAESWSHLAPWQWLFILEGIPTLVLGVIVFFYLTDHPKDAKWLSAPERELLIARLAHEKHHHPSGHAAELKHAFANPKVWLLGFLYALLMFGFYTINYWTPTIIKESLLVAGILTPLTERHVEYLLVGLLSAIPFGAAAIGMSVIGLHSDRTNERRWHIAFSALLASLGLAFAALAYLFLPKSMMSYTTIIGLSVAAVGIWSTLGPFWTLPSHLLTGTAAAAGIALVNSLGNLGGGFGGPKLIAFLKERTGSDAGGLLVGAGLLLLAGTLTAVLKFEHKVDHAPPAFPIDPNTEEQQMLADESSPPQP
jgi:MFS transporter, ACS family, tartrate transporter